MKLFTSFLLTLLTVVAVVAQPTVVNYRISTLPNSTSVAMISYSDGHVELTNTIPTGLTFSRKGGRLIRTYNPSGKRQWNISQFGQNQYYSPTFKLAIDFNPGGLSVAQRKAYGINLFNFWALSDNDKASLTYGDGMLYLTEHGLHEDLEGAGYFECTLAEYEAQIWKTMPSCGYGADPGVKLLVFNLESSNGWSKDAYGSGSHWPSWDSHKTKWITLESQTGGMTLEQLANTPGLMQAEEAVRRANRRIIMHKVAKVKGKPGLLTSDGSSMYQGLPRMDFVNSTGIFLDGYADVSHIGGSNGTITLNGRTYTGVTGSHWAHEDVMDGYYYIFDKDMDASAYQATFIAKVDSTQNYPYLWSKLLTRHITADEKGYIQLNRKRMIARQGQPRPILRQIEPQYEGDGMGLFSGGVYTGSYVNTRMTWNDLQPSATGDVEPPKLWQPPYYNYSRYIVTRFFAGNENGWGLYVFPPANPTWVNKSLSETPIFNHHLNSLEAILQARADLQPYEQWFTNSTLVEDPEVQIGGVGSFTAYSGTEAYNYDAGVQGVQKPCYMMRFKPQTNGDIRVVVVGGMNQGWTDERIDIIRAPSSFTALAGNKFKVKLRGPSAQVCEFLVKSTDSNQTYEALFNANTAYEKPGYSGRVGVPTSGTSTGTVSTTTITIPAFSQTVPYSAATKSDFLSASGDGSHHYNTFKSPADWADYTISDAPVTSNDYTLTFNYNTNYTCSGCGTGEYLINGGSAVSFPMDGAAGGVRTVNFTGISLNKGTNTIRFRGTSEPSTYFQNYVAVSRASSTSTISVTTVVTSSTACGFAVSTTNQSVGCGASFTLSASTSGTAASGLNFSWNRSGFSASGQQTAVLAPSVSGTYTYTVTAGKLGCANKTAVSTITVSGCSSNSLVSLGLNPDFTPPADQGWNITTTREKYIETNAMKVGFLRGGAAISYMALKSDNRNLINSHLVYWNDDPADFRYNTTTDDLGRQLMFFSDYMSPGPNEQGGRGFILKNGKRTGNLKNSANVDIETGGGYKGFVFNTGANTVQGGSLYPAMDFSPILSSAVYTHPTRGTEFYAKMRPMIWGVKGEQGWVTGEQWCWFAAPNVLGYFARHTVEVRDAARFDEQRKFEAQNQENPSIYAIAPLTQVLIDIPGQSRKNIYQSDGSSQKYYTTTAKIGAYEGSGGKGITYYSPMNSQVGAMASTAGTGSATGGWADDPFSYIQGAPSVNYDNPGVYEDYGYIILGTEAEANAAIANLPGIDQSFDFDFSKENMRWYNGNSRLIKEPAGWTLYLDPHTDNGVTSYLAKMMAPARAWQASGFTKINLEIACTNTTSLRLEYQKPGLTYENQYSTVFPVQGDGQFHTYSINVSDLGSNFSGIISSIGFSAGPGTQPNAKVVVKRIWKN